MRRQEEWCRTCGRVTESDCTVDPDVTTWRCIVCGTVVDTMFTDAEVDWEDDDCDSNENE
jgi:hypothetical protein